MIPGKFMFSTPWNDKRLKQISGQAKALDIFFQMYHPEVAIEKYINYVRKKDQG